MAELDAVDWYSKRIDATDDAELKALLPPIATKKGKTRR